MVQPHSLIPTADCGINLSIVDGGFIDSLTLRNITITGVNTAMFLRLGNQGRKYTPSAPTPPVGYIRNVLFQNITITAESNLTSSITGIPGYYMEDVSLKDITINFSGGAQSVRPGFVVPENETERPNCDIFGDTMPAHGLYVRHVRNITFDNVCFNADAVDLRPALIMDDVVESPQYEAIQTGNQYCLSEIASSIENLTDSDFIFSPDRKTGTVVIRFAGNALIENISVSLFDVTGRKLLEKEFSLNELKINFNAHPGVYYCVMKSGGKVFGRKFIW